MPKVLGSFFKRTPDDWCPSWTLRTKNYVEASRVLEIRLHDLNSGPQHPPLWRICVSGADDTRMEFDTRDYAKFYAVVSELIHMESVSMEALEKLGFTFQ